MKMGISDSSKSRWTIGSRGKSTSPTEQSGIPVVVNEGLKDFIQKKG